jgi:biotin carboxylase
MRDSILLLVLGDHSKYFYVDGRCVLDDLPWNVVVLTNRVSAAAFKAMKPNLDVRLVPWSDTQKVTQIVCQIASEQPVRFVCTLNEALLELAAQMRHELGLPGMSADLVQRFRNKILMKQMAHAAGLAVPEHAPCTDRAAVLGLAQRHVRLVIKPIDGIGARRVSFVDSPEQIAAWYAQHADVSDYEAEQYIEGTLYHVNAVVQQGRVLLNACARYEPGMANIDFCSGTPFVSVMLEHGSLRARLEAFSDRVLAALGLVDGVTHLECFVTPDDRIVLCEVAARPGGGGIVEMIEAQFGVHYAVAGLLLQCGRADLLAIGRPEHQGVYGLMGFRLARNCRIQTIAHEQAFAEDGMVIARILVKPGDFVPAAKHCTDFVALLVFASDNDADFHAKSRRHLARFNAELSVVH